MPACMQKLFRLKLKENNLDFITFNLKKVYTLYYKSSHNFTIYIKPFDSMLYCITSKETKSTSLYKMWLGYTISKFKDFVMVCQGNDTKIKWLNEVQYL